MAKPVRFGLFAANDARERFCAWIRFWGPLRGYPPFEELIANPLIGAVEMDARK